ncbi:rhomboid family intramembrane serine protease [Streptomyces vietnamensis]|uniref:Rhomboid family protein n=1 Tax=Streptomyces vietnamensis TaxID=362257 RepID=A0A0B5HVV3_9ACTN|nr:rhomboid family intramembrane serine protease [Streptomyces vietnamensis]AJF66125.1 Rhomboid family protein [Streptomyces vietnamensis]
MDTQPGLLRCYRHPEAETGVRCARCERPICPQCMIPASVGFQCPECVRNGSGTGHAAGANQPRTLAGGRVAADGRLVTKILMAINLALFIAVQVVGDRLLDDLALIGGGHVVLPNGEPVGVADGEWYRLLTSAFLHQELPHFLFNMLGLWMIGGIVEPELGRIRYAALCLLSALSGSTLAYLLSPHTQFSLGASGMVYGLIGAWIVLARRRRQDMRPALLFVALNLLITFTRPGISWEAHIGGLVAGVLVTYAMVHAPRARRDLVQYGACGLVLLIDLGIVLARSAALT